MKHNHYSDLPSKPNRPQGLVKDSSEHEAVTTLRIFVVDSGTGPDSPPAKILKLCADELAKAIQILASRIIATGEWPNLWKIHWIVPLHKKKSIYDPNNYRGVHLTCQLSKVVERLLKSRLMPFVTRSEGFGPNQFAYTPARGARDVLAMLVMIWVQALALGRKVAVYCSDVSGAFDKVKVERLVCKLKSKKLNSKLIDVLTSWLQQ